MSNENLTGEEQAQLFYLASLASFALYDRHPCLLYTRLGSYATRPSAVDCLVIVRETVPSNEAISAIPALKVGLRDLLQDPTRRNSIVRDEEIIQDIEPILSDLPMSDASKAGLLLQYRQNISLELMTSDEACGDLAEVRPISAGRPGSSDSATNDFASRVAEGVEEAGWTFYTDLASLKEALKGESMADIVLPQRRLTEDCKLTSVVLCSVRR